MPIVSTDIKIFLSGGSANSNVNLSIGGVKSSVEVVDNTLNNLFDDVTGTESLAGDTNYRMVYVYDNHGSLTMQNTRVYISSNTTSTDDTFDIGPAAAGLNATETAVANEATAPASVSFSAPSTYAGGINLGNIPFSQRYGLWIRRTVNAAAGATDANAATLKFDCDTSA